MAKDPHCDSPQTLEKRKYRGKLIHKGVQEMCKLFVSKIFVCESLDTLHALLPPLRCLFKLCTEFPVHFKSDKMQIAKKIELQSIYNPTYKNAWQMDCFHHLIEIGMFSKYMCDGFRALTAVSPGCLATVIKSHRTWIPTLCFHPPT